MAETHVLSALQAKHRRIKGLIASRAGLSTSEETMAEVAIKIAELVAA